MILKKRGEAYMQNNSRECHLCNYNFNPGMWKTVFLSVRKHFHDMNVTELQFKSVHVRYTLLTVLFPNLTIQAHKIHIK